MRILVVTNLYPPHHLGGYGSACAGTVDAWRAAGHDVEVLTSTWRRDDVPADAPGPNGERVRRDLPIHWDNHALLSRSWPRRIALEQRTRQVVRGTARDFQPDVVSIWNAAGMSFGQFTYWADEDIPMVLVLADDWLVFGRDLDPWAHSFSGPGVLRRAAAKIVSATTGLSTSVTSLGPAPIAVFTSDHLRRRALAGHRWRLGRTPVTPLGMDVEVFPPRVEPRATDTWSGHLLYVGRLEKRKGVHTVLRAVARVDGVRLEIIGDGDPGSEAQLRDLARTLGVESRVTWRGRQPGAVVREAHERADALVFPSEWDEPFGMVPVEAMASGLPVIGTGTGGSGEFLVDGVTAVRCPPGDVDALAAAIRRLAGDHDLRARLAEAGPQVAEWLSWDAFASDCLAWHMVAVDEDAPTRHDRPALPPQLRSEIPPAADVRVGIVNWNAGEHLARCLDALPDALGDLAAEIVVVDNASADGSEKAAEDRPGVRLVRNDRNVGYSRAINQALAGSMADVLIALNPDTAPGPGTLAQLVERLREQPDVGLVAPRLIGSDGQQQETARQFPSVRLGIVANLLPPGLRSRRLKDRFWLDGATHEGRRVDVPWVIGAVHVLRGAAVATERPYRERWFIYVEDMDLCWRLRERGWRVRLEGDVEVTHVGNVSGALAYGEGRMARYLRETYDWCAQVRGRLFARIYALLSLLGTLLWLVRQQRHVGPHVRRSQRRALGRALMVHARTVVLGPAPPTAAARSPDAGPAPDDRPDEAEA